MVVGGELGPAAALRIVVQKLRHRPRDRESVEGAGSPADLVENHQTFRRDVIEDVRRFDHLHHEGALPAGEVVGGPDPGEDAVHQPDLRRLRRNERAHLRHDDQKSGLPDVGGFAGHVRTGDDHHPVAVAVEQAVVWDEIFRAEQRVEHRMASAADDQPVVLEDARPAVVMKPCTFSQRGERINLCEHVGGVLNLRGKSEHIFAQLLKELVFQGARLLLRAEDLALQLLELRRDEPFGVDQCLLADVILRHGGEIGLAHLDVVAEDRIELHLERFDAGALLFALLNLRKPALAVGGGGAQFVELRGVSRTDHPAVGEQRRGFVGDGGVDPGGEFREEFEPGIELFEQWSGEDAEQGFDSRQYAERSREGLEIARPGAADVETPHNSLQVADDADGFAQFGKRQRIEGELLDRVEPRDDGVVVAERPEHPAAQPPPAHWGDGVVEHAEQGAVFTGAEHGFDQFEVALRDGVQFERMVERIEFEPVDVGGVLPEIFGGVTEHRAGGGDGERQVAAAKAVESGDLKMFFEEALGPLGFELFGIKFGPEDLVPGLRPGVVGAEFGG